MRSVIIFIFFLIPFFTKAQTDLLVLERRGAQVHTYTNGDELDMETIYHQRFLGTITELRHDSVYINGQAFHYKEIAIVHRTRDKSGLLLLGTGMMVAGGGLFILGAVNGLVRGDQSSSWYTSGGLITGAVLIGGGYLARRAYFANYHLGGRYKLNYLELNPNKK